MGSGLCRHSFFPLLAHLRLEIFLHMIRQIAALADGPGDERSAAHDFSCRKHAVERGHQGSVVDESRTPAADGKTGGPKVLRHFFRLSTKALASTKTETCGT